MSATTALICILICLVVLIILVNIIYRMTEDWVTADDDDKAWSDGYDAGYEAAKRAFKAMNEKDLQSFRMS